MEIFFGLVLLAVTFMVHKKNMNGDFLNGRPSAGMVLMCIALAGFGILNLVSGLSSLTKSSYISARNMNGEQIKVKDLKTKPVILQVYNRSTSSEKTQCSERHGSLVHYTKTYPCTYVYETTNAQVVYLATDDHGMEVLVNPEQRVLTTLARIEK